MLITTTIIVIIGVIVKGTFKKENDTDRTNNAAGDNKVPLVFGGRLEAGVQLTSNPNRNTNDHGRNGYSSQQGYSDRRADQRAQLPEDFLFPGPRLLAPESTAGGTKDAKKKTKQKKNRK